jgi:hypothetical protein
VRSLGITDGLGVLAKLLQGLADHFILGWIAAGLHLVVNVTL